MDKKRGVTIIEIIVAVSLLGIMFMLVVPLIRGYDKVDDRIKMQNKLDSEFSVVSNFIKRKIRSAKRTDKSSGGVYNPKFAGAFDIFDTDPSLFFAGANVKAAGEKGSVLFLEVPEYGGSSSEFVFFIFEDNKIKYREGFTGTNEVFMENVEDASFGFREGIVTFFIDMDVGDMEGKIRDSIGDSAVTKIDIELPE